MSCRNIVAIYNHSIDLTLLDLELLLQEKLQDDFLKVAEVHWSLNFKTVVLIRLSGKRCLSKMKWTKNMTLDGTFPSLITYDRSHFRELVRGLQFHWPELKQGMMEKLLRKEMQPLEYLKRHPQDLIAYPQLRRSLEIVEAEKQEKVLKSMKMEKKRGTYLFGSAGSGKTTLAIECLLTQPYYQKSMVTKTYDSYRYEESIFLD